MLALPASRQQLKGEVEPDGFRIASAFNDGHVEIHDATSRTVLLTYKPHNEPIMAIKWSPTDEFMFGNSRMASITARDWNGR